MQSRQVAHGHRLVGAGQELPDDASLRYLGTAMLEGGGMALHVFNAVIA